MLEIVCTCSIFYEKQLMRFVVDVYDDVVVVVAVHATNKLSFTHWKKNKSNKKLLWKVCFFSTEWNASIKNQFKQSVA